MKDTKKFLLIGFLLTLLILAAGCSPAQTTVEPETRAPVETEQATLPPTELPTATIQEQEVTEEPEETEAPDENETDDDAMPSEETSACVACHTDQAMLIDTADPVEEVESENEGAG
jgi:septal ring-binding cell division protein DamX